MALLQSGKIFYIKVGMEDYKDEKGSYPSNKVQYCDWFIKQFSEALAITDPDYNQIKYTHYSDHTNPYFLLPYINKDTEEKLALHFNYYTSKLEVEVAMQGAGGYDDNTLLYPAWNNRYIKNYFVCNTENGIESGHIGDYMIDANKHTTLVIDTRFLDSHGFYTLGAASSSYKITKAYVAPNIFICDIINKFNKKHTDGIFDLCSFGGRGNLYPDFSTNYSSTVSFGKPSIGIFLADYNGGTGFYPQIFTNEEDTFSVVKIHFGQFKPAKDIYLTRATASTLADFCYYENMSEEKNSWKEVERVDSFGGKRNFLLGLNSIYLEDKSPNNEWIPVIEATKEPFALKFSSDEKFTLSVSKPSWNGTMEYSFDKGKTWTEWNGKELLGNKEKSIYLRGTGNTRITGHNTPLDNATVYDDPCKWSFTGKYIKGNIETLLDYKTVQKEEHPKMDNYCYRALFYGCSSLREAPELPAMDLKDCCYFRMFMNCTSLLATPDLPSAKLATYCYGNMFFGCNSLTKAPELPAMTLAPFCYIGMFQFCRSFVKVPKLPALIMAESCYESMFFGCSILNEVPELPSTKLAKGCYNQMFVYCYALTKMPKLPATSLAYECYKYMFFNCSKIKVSRTKTSLYPNNYRIPESGTGTNATNALQYMFYGTGGSFTGTPSINTTYYTSNEVV